MDKRLSDCDRLQNLDLTTKICSKSRKSKAIFISVSLLFLIGYYDELRFPILRSSILQSKKLKEGNYVSRDAKVKPEVAWLLSFPNSGTSFTTALVRVLTETSTATNYEESHHPSPVFPEIDSPIILRKKLPLPEKGYILTKTHCTRCSSGQKSLIKTTDDFTQGCQTMKLNSGCREYDAAIVKRAVHLFRNPFDNVVGRFHLEFKSKNKRGDTEWTTKYPYSKEGFHQWCEDYSHHQSYKPDKKFIKYLKNSGLVCPIEFFKYVQFHNNAFNMTNTLNIPTQVIDYTTYHTDYQGTIDKLLTFLGQEQVPGTEKDFYYSSHEDYYTEDERKKIAMFLLKHASPEVGEYLNNKYLEKNL